MSWLSPSSPALVSPPLHFLFCSLPPPLPSRVSGFLYIPGTGRKRSSSLFQWVDGGGLSGPIRSLRQSPQLASGMGRPCRKKPSTLSEILSPGRFSPPPLLCINSKPTHTRATLFQTGPSRLSLCHCINADVSRSRWLSWPRDGRLARREYGRERGGGRQRGSGPISYLVARQPGGWGAFPPFFQ